MECRISPGEAIRAYRAKKGITLTSLAAVLHCSKSELSLYENNKKQIGKLRRLLWSTIVPEFTPDMLTREGQKSCDDTDALSKDDKKKRQAVKSSDDNCSECGHQIPSQHQIKSPGCIMCSHCTDR